MPTSHDPPHLFDLTGRVALITGGSRGLGREMAFAFARFGADVMIASRKQDSCESTAEEIRAATGRRARRSPTCSPASPRTVRGRPPSSARGPSLTLTPRRVRVIRLS